MTTASKFIDPEEVQFEGEEDTFYISKIPAFYAQEIFMSAATAFQRKDAGSLPRETVLKLLSYTALKMDDEGVKSAVCLDNPVAVNTYVKDPFTLLALEMKMIEKNYSFLFDGRLQKVLEPMLASMKGTETSSQSSATS